MSHAAALHAPPASPYASPPSSAPPAPTPPSVVPHNVPAALSSFVGRAAERDALAAALGGARLVTVTGPGGAGKTRLAREVAAARAAADPEGVRWVELAPVADAGGLAAAVGDALGVRLPAGADAAPALVLALGGRGALLVLDNCEHVIDAAAELAAALLRACPRLAVLATSREALAVEGELAWVLPPLGHPPLGHPPLGHPSLGPAGAALTAAAAAEFDAVRLFVERARAASPAFALTDANAAAVAAVCARLDGLPLALELAAAQVPAFGAEQLAARLDDALGVLTRGRRAAPARHQTLRALLDWSWARLGAEERHVLARLTVFRDAFTLDAAAAVAAGGAGDAVASEGAAVAALGRLVEQSLVDVRDTPGPVGGEVRYVLRETVRQYHPTPPPPEPGEARAAADRHLAWAAAVAADAAPRFWSAEWFAEAGRVGLVADDLRAAVLWAADSADASPAGRRRAAEALAIVGVLQHRWLVAGGQDDAIRTIVLALRAGVAAGLATEGAPGAWAPTPGLSAAEGAALGEALLCWMIITMIQARPRDALRAHAGAAATWEAALAAVVAEGRAPGLEVRRGRWYTPMVAAEARLVLGDVAGALAEGPAVLADARASGDPRAVASATARVGFHLGLAGRRAEGVPLLEEAAAAWRVQGDRLFQTLTEQSLGDLAYAAGDLARAAASVRATVAIQREAHAAWNLARTLVLAAAVLAAAAEQAGRPLAPDAAALAARVLGASDQLRARAGLVLQLYDRAAYERASAAVEAALGPDAARTARAAGAGLAPAAAMDAAAEAADRAAQAAAAAPAAPNAAPNPAPNDAPNEAPNGAPNAATDEARRAPQDAAPAAPNAPSAARPVQSAAHAPGPGGAAGAPPLRVRDLGPLAVERGGAAADDPPAGKVAELLVYLAAHPEGRTKEQIGLALWPDAAPARVRSSFHFTLHQLRRALGAEWVAFAGGRYRLAAGAESDAGAALAAAAELRRAEAARAPLDEAALDAAERAFAAARGPLGEGLAAGAWLAEHQDAVQAAVGDGLQALARQHARAGRRGRAAALLRQLVARDPLREAAHRDLMVLLAADGERARALAHYDALAAQLARELGAAPDRDTRALAEQLRARG